MSRKKGAAPTMQTILLMIIMLGILVVFIVAVTKTQSQNTLINLNEYGVMKLENTFALTNRSLGMTWYIFAVQSVFDVTDSSVRCGTDDIEIAGDNIMPDNYWYYYDKEKGPKSISITDPSLPVPNAMDFITGANADGNPEKYNDFQPAICYPRDKRGTVNGANIEGSAIQIMEEKFADLKDKLDLNPSANGINIKIVPIDPTQRQGADVVSGPITEKWSEFVIDKNLNNPGKPMVNKTNKQWIKLADGAITEDTENNNTIYTEFPNFMGFSRSLVGNVFIKLNNIPDKLNYRDVNNAEYDMSDTYATRILRYIKEDLINPVAYNAFGSSPDRKTKVTESYKKFGLRSSDSEDGVIFGTSNDDTADDMGLILSYDTAVTMREGSGAAAVTCDSPPADYAGMIETEVDKYKNSDSGNWEFGQMQISKEDIVAFVKGLIRQESSWNPEAVSCAGAAGLGQLMRGTAISYGLNVPDYDKSTYQCGGRNWKDFPSCNIVTVQNCDFAGDERFNPEKNIQASVNYIYDIMKDFSVYTNDGENLIKLVAAAYNWGPYRVKGAITDVGVGANGIMFDNIVSKMPGETQDYVPKVLGGFACYGGTLSGGDAYYYHDESSNKFIKRPFSMTVKAKDDIAVIDCFGSLSALQFFSWKQPPKPGYYTNPITTGDMMCCGGKLWLCNSGIEKNSHMAISGDKIGSIDGNIDNAGMCSNLVEKMHAESAPQAREFWLQCNPDGFRFYAIYCNSYTSESECRSHGCSWYTTRETEYCSNPPP